MAIRVRDLPSSPPPSTLSGRAVYLLRAGHPALGLAPPLDTRGRGLGGSPTLHESKWIYHRLLPGVAAAIRRRAMKDLTHIYAILAQPTGQYLVSLNGGICRVDVTKRNPRHVEVELIELGPMVNIADLVQERLAAALTDALGETKTYPPATCPRCAAPVAQGDLTAHVQGCEGRP